LSISKTLALASKRSLSFVEELGSGLPACSAVYQGMGLNKGVVKVWKQTLAKANVAKATNFNNLHGMPLLSSLACALR